MFCPTTVLITGANRGLGLEFVKQFLKLDKPPRVLFATCRDIDNAEELKSLVKAYPSLRILKLDVTDVNTIERVARDVETALGDQGLDLLINNAAISLFMHSMDSISADKLKQTFQVNVIGPMMVSKFFLPLLKKSSSKPGANGTAIINVSSIIGSISQNDNGGFHGYRTSKAALNMFTKSLSIEMKEYGVWVVSLNPGWVKTDMGGPDAPLSKEESIASCMNVIFNLTKDQNGKLIDYTGGKVIDW